MVNYFLPFLWVHGESEETYRKMIRVIYESNIRAFCVEARPHKEFCQEKWWKDMEIILDEAQNLEMKVYILDDKHFPTGYAAGAVLSAPPELRRQGLVHKVFDVNSNIKLNLKKVMKPKLTAMYAFTNIYNKNYRKENRFSDHRLLSVVAVRKDECNEMIDLSNEVCEGTLKWQPPCGEWEVHICFLTRNIGSHRGYINMMDWESCRLLIDAVYEPHYQHFKEKFGNVIAGFFSDEPELGNNSMYKMENPLGTEQDLPWSRELEKLLTEKYGENYTRLLPTLWSNKCNPQKTAKFRFDYMNAVSFLVEKNFSYQIGTWCEEHNVEYIGHVVEDNNQHARTGTSLGHYFRGLKWQTMAGIDDIGGQVFPGHEDKKEKSVLGFENDGEFYHYALGKLGSSLATVNPRMKGRAMCEIFGNYGWSEGIYLEKYLLDHFMVRGINYFVPHAFTCSSYPEKDCPPHFYAQGNNPLYRHFGKLMEYGNRICHLISNGEAETPVAILYHGEAEWAGKAMFMQKPARICLEHQIDFCFIPADAFADKEFYNTSITDVLTINQRQFKVLIIPYAQYITPETSFAIKELVDNGGKVIIIDNLPDGLTNGKELPEWIAESMVVRMEELWMNIKMYHMVQLQPENNRIRVLHYRGIENLYYLFNEGDSLYSGEVILAESEEVCAYNPWKNQYEDIEQKDNKVTVNIYPNESIFIVEKKDKKVVPTLVLRGTPQKQTEFYMSECRSIDYPKFTNRKKRSLESYDRIKPNFSGFIRYETMILPGNEFTGLEICEAKEGVEVFVNGQTAGIQIIPPYRYDLSNLCIQGMENQLIIEVATTLERERGSIKKALPTGICGDVYLYR